MSTPALPRYDFYRGPQKLPDAWTLKRGDITMRCALSTHRLGWELRLSAGANSLRTQVCRTEKDVTDTSDAWRVEATSKGWS